MEGLLKNTVVMVVDDSADICDLLRCALEQSGASVSVAQTVESAIATFRKHIPHAVVVDIRLGSSDGYALIKAIREHNAEYRGFTPAIAVTGFASPEDEERAIGAGFNAYMAKPFDPFEVVRSIANMLYGPRNAVA
jgi:CheY-like chemotaxis protein